MEFLSPEQSLTLTRGDFDEATFRRLVAQKGLAVRWTQTAECPCKPKSVDTGFNLQDIDDIDSGEGATSACPVCAGAGLIYHSPQEVKAIITGAEGDYLNARYGGYREGVINITLNPEHLPSFGDRLELLESVMLYRETIEVGALDLQPLRFAIAQRDLRLRDGDRSFRVIYAHKTDPLTGLALADGDITESGDYAVEDSKIRWINKPEEGTRVSFTYFIHPTYTVASYPNSIRDTKTRKKSPTEQLTPLLVRVQAKLEFLSPQG